MRYFLERRFSHLDIAGIAIVVALIQLGRYVAAALVFLVMPVISLAAEKRWLKKS